MTLYLFKRNFKLSYFTIGCSLHIKNALYLMHIKLWAWFTELGRIVLKIWVFPLGKNTPQLQISWVKPCLEVPFFLFQWYALSFCVNPHNLPNCTNWSHLQRLFLSRSMWSRGWFGGNNDRFCIYPLSDFYWGVIKKCLNIYRHIFVPNLVN